MDAAKDLFFRYDGSKFYMSRDGADREYAQYGISKAIEQQWLKELTAQKLAALADPGIWRTVHFLIHHSHFTHLPELLTASPLGKLWEKAAYLETLLEYLAKCRERGLFRDQIDKGCDHVASLAEALLRRARSTRSRDRIQAIIDAAVSAHGG